MAHTPMTVRLQNGLHLSFHEAALVDYAAYVLDHRRDRHVAHESHAVVGRRPRADRDAVQDAVAYGADRAERGPLLDSTLILNLNEPNVLGDVSWVEPGKYVGVWWAMHIKQTTWEPGPTHGATTAETKRYVDFAAAHGFDGVLVEGWNLGWDKDWYASGGKQFSFTQAYPDFDLRAVTDYARRKGVRLVGHHETAANVGVYEPQMPAASTLYESLGVRQVKTGYVADAGDVRRLDEHGVELHEWHDGQFQVGHHLRVVQEAAKHRISIIAHEPIKDTGLRRTYPNWLSREGARGQEYNAWGEPTNPPEHVAILPFTRMLCGTVRLHARHRRPRRLRLRSIVSQHTLAKELSLYVVLYAPVQMAADLPENYDEARRRVPVHQGRADGLGRIARPRGRGRRLRRDRTQGTRPPGLVRRCAHRRARAHAEAALDFLDRGRALRRRDLP